MANYDHNVIPLKTLIRFPGWSDPEAGTGYCFFNAPLEIGGIVEPRLTLHGGCQIDAPDRHVTFELHLSKMPGVKMRPLERIDWRSLRGGHSNVRRKYMPNCKARVSDTHLHAFDMNYDANRQKMYSEDLPFARDIEDDVSNFNKLLIFTGKQFKIANINLVLAPRWEYSLDLDNHK